MLTEKEVLAKWDVSIRARRKLLGLSLGCSVLWLWLFRKGTLVLAPHTEKSLGLFMCRFHYVLSCQNLTKRSMRNEGMRCCGATQRRGSSWREDKSKCGPNFCALTRAKNFFGDTLSQNRPPGHPIPKSAALRVGV